MRARRLLAFALLRLVAGLPTPDASLSDSVALSDRIGLTGSAQTIALDHLYPSTRNASNATRAVYAHFLVGIVQMYNVSDWEDDMRTAKSAGIDGFSLVRSRAGTC